MRRKISLALGAFSVLWLAVVGPVLGENVGDAVSGGMTPADVLTLAGASIVCSLVMGALVSALGWTSPANAAIKDRFGPLLALAVGVVVVGGFGILQGADLVSALLTGLLAGSTSMGVHDVVSVATG